jgi:hypothetical protein
MSAFTAWAMTQSAFVFAVRAGQQDLDLGLERGHDGGAALLGGTGYPSAVGQDSGRFSRRG